ncbi:MAG: hypothetical protein V2A73_00825 [Pseudomonadota bacterium]
MSIRDRGALAGKPHQTGQPSGRKGKGMNYDAFRTAWSQALRTAGLVGPLPPEETIDLAAMSRSFSVTVGKFAPLAAKPFAASMQLRWKWHAIDSARAETVEEDVLTELLGREEARGVVTRRPMLRVDIELQGWLAQEKPLLLPGSETWRTWVNDIMGKLETVLPVANREEQDGIMAVLCWRGEPEARTRCGPLGEQWLLGVQLSAWQGINLPRQWDSPKRRNDEEGPEAELEAFAKRMRAALDTWSKSLKALLPATGKMN